MLTQNSAGYSSQETKDLRAGWGCDTYIRDLHFFLVVDCVDSQGTLVDEVVQTGVRVHKDLLWGGEAGR